jgi:aspartate aminotransferase
MGISKKLEQEMQRSSWIRKMFVEAERLKKERGADFILDLSLGNPIAEPPEAFLTALKNAVVDSPPGMHRYMNNAGYPETRRAVAALVSEEQGVKITEDHVLMSCGAAGALNVVLKSLLDPGDEVIIFAPFFVEYIFYADNHGGKARIVESDEEFQPDADRLREAITEKTKAVIINNPNNPTGVIYPVAKTREMADVLSDASAKYGHPIYLLSDEVYRHIIYDDAELPSVFKEYDHSVIVTSFSKDLGLAGERIGYIAMSPKIEDTEAMFAACATTNRSLGFVNAPALMQRSIRACLEARVDLDLYRRNREVLYKSLIKAGFHVVRPTGAFYIFPKVPDPDDVAYCGFLREKGIIVVPGSGFGRPGHVRISYSVEREVAQKAAERFAEIGLATGAKSGA